MRYDRVKIYIEVTNYSQKKVLKCPHSITPPFQTFCSALESSYSRSTLPACMHNKSVFFSRNGVGTCTAGASQLQSNPIGDFEIFWHVEAQSTTDEPIQYPPHAPVAPLPVSNCCVSSAMLIVVEMWSVLGIPRVPLSRMWSSEDREMHSPRWLPEEKKTHESPTAVSSSCLQLMEDHDGGCCGHPQHDSNCSAF